MPYCIHCGVNLDHRYTNCPLCSIPVEYPTKRESLPPLYPNVINKISIIKSQVNERDWITIHFIGFLTFLASLLTIGLDFYLNKSLTWSLITTLSVLLSYFVITVTINLKSNPIILYSYINILIGLYLFALDILTTGNSWFINYALPCFITLQIISFIIKIIFNFIISKLFRSFILTIGTNIFLIIVNQITTQKISWSLIVSSVLVPVSLYLLFLSLKIFNIKKKVK